MKYRRLGSTNLTVSVIGVGTWQFGGERGKGLLTGKYRPGTRFTNAADTRSRRPTDEVDRRLEAAQRIREEEVPKGTPMAAWALAWCLQHPAVTAVIPGGKSSQQIAANAKAAELTLMAADHPQAVAP